MRKVVLSGQGCATVSTLAGGGKAGADDGIGKAACFNHPAGITAGPTGVVFVSDCNNHVVRRISLLK